MSKVKQGQSFLDKVLQQTGAIENALEMAILNDRSITDRVKKGEEYKVTEITKASVVDFYNKTEEPATGMFISEIIKEPMEPEFLGIGQMAISTTFKVK